MVDSIPIALSPPSKINSSLLPSEQLTCSAEVGLTYPNGLALGAASGMKACSAIQEIFGFLGIE